MTPSPGVLPLLLLSQRSLILVTLNIYNIQVTPGDPCCLHLDAVGLSQTSPSTLHFSLDVVDCVSHCVNHVLTCNPHHGTSDQKGGSSRCSEVRPLGGGED